MREDNLRDIGWIGRRDVMRLLGVGGAALAAGLPTRVHAAAAKNTLVLGLDISDSITFDPAREAQYTPPLTLTAAYESLITMTPGDYLNVKPTLASAWARTPDGKGWRFTMRPGTKFNSGNPVTVDDVKWSLERVINVKDQPSQYVALVDHVTIVDDKTIDVIMKDPAAPLPCCAVEFRRDGTQGGRGARRHQRAECQYRRQGHPMAEPELGRRRAVHAGGVDAECTDPADAQSALLARTGAFRARGAAPHG
jgi:hypothetical protein